MSRRKRLRVSVSLATAAALALAPAALGESWIVQVAEGSAAPSTAYRYRLVVDAQRAVLEGDGVGSRSRSLENLQGIAITGSPATDTLVVDLDGDLPELVIDYDGAGGFDSLVIEGTVELDSVTYAPGPGNDEGVLTYRLDDRMLEIRFRGLEPIADSTAAATVIVDTYNGVGDANTITYSAGGIGCNSSDTTWGLLQIDALECLEFKNKGVVDIRAGNGADVFNLFNASKPTGLTQLIARGGNGADMVNLRSAPSGLVTKLYGGADSDVFRVSSAAPALGGSLDSILGDVTVDGDGHGSGAASGIEIKGVAYFVDTGDYLSIDDLFDADAGTYSVSATTVSRDGTGTITYATTESLQLFTSAGAATVNVSDTPSTSFVAIATQGGADAVNLLGSGADSILDVSTASGADLVTVTATGADGANADGLGAFLRVSAGPGADLMVLTGNGTDSRTLLDGQEDADQLEVRAAVAGSVVVADGGPQNDLVFVGESDSLDGVLGDVCVVGGGHAAIPTFTLQIDGDSNTLPVGDLLDVRDLADLDANTYQISSTAVDRSGAGSIEYLDVETLNVQTSSLGPSSVAVASTPAAVSVFVQSSGSQPDLFNVLDTGVDGILVVNLFGGNDSATLHRVGGDGGDADALGAFVQLHGGDGADAFSYLGPPATVLPSGGDGVILPPGGQRIQYLSFESAAYHPDFGDAPDSYGTLLSSLGPRHGGGGLLRLGSLWDAEGDGAPGTGASGDGTDEDGIVFTTPIELGPDTVGANLTVDSSGSGRVDAWIDFDLDGGFDDPSERMLTGSMVVAGSNYESFTSFAAAAPGPTYARFRLSSGGVLAPTGPSDDGEVEDYAVTIRPVDELDLMNRVESVVRTFWACTSISAGDVFTLVGGADIGLHAGNLVVLRDGSSVEEGAALRISLGAVPGCP